MVSKINKKAMRMHRHVRVRGKISGTPERPRLNVFRSNANIYAQIIDEDVYKRQVLPSYCLTSI